MSRYSDLVAKLVKLSNRPDLTAEISSCLVDATMELHKLDFFYKDLQTGVIELTSQGQQQFDLDLSTFTRFRAIKDIVPVVPTSNNPFADCCPSKLRSNPSFEYCRCNSNWWRVLGGKLTVNTNLRVDQLNLYYYQLPNAVANDSYSSWIADQYEEALTDLVLCKLFTLLRDYAAANLYSSKMGTREGPTGHIAVIIGDNLEQQIR